MTSAINGRIVFKQGPRNYLEANIRRNSLVFDTDNNTILYSPSGTNYYEFFPGHGVGVSGDVPWSSITGEPVASISTSGLLSVSDWIKFNNKADLSAVSASQGISAVTWDIITGTPIASISTSGVITSVDWNRFNSKVDVSALSGIGSGGGTVSSVGLSSNTLTVTNSPITSSGTFSVELSSVVVAGVSTKVSYDQFGRIISGGSLVSADIPSLPTTKIVTDSSNRFVSDSQINSWTSASVSAHTHSNKSTLDNINQNLNTSSSPTFSSVSASNFNDVNFSGDKVLVSDISKNIVESVITSTQLNYLSGTSANIQTQINNSKALIPQTFASTNTSGLLTSSDWNTFNNKSNLTSADVFVISTNVSVSSVSALGLTDMGSYIQTSKPIVLPNGVIFSPFTQRYVSGSPSMSALTISAGMSQQIKLPTGTSYRLWWYGVGPFAYRTGTSSVAALASDFPAMVGYTQIINTVDQYLAVYGIGAGSVVIEAGDGGLNSVESETYTIASSSASGILTSADWNRFNNKADLSAVSSASSVSWTGITNVPVASSGTSGVISSADWNTFNNKSDVTLQDVITVSNETYSMNVSSLGLEDMGTYVQASKPLLNVSGNSIETLRTGNKIVVAGNSICFYATNFYGTNRNTRSEFNNSVVTAGTVRYPSYIKLKDFFPVKLVCTISGTTGSQEPEWPTVNNTVADGSVVWTVSADTDGYGTIPGYFNIANSILGQAFNPLMYVGAKSRRWDYIKAIMDREFAKDIDPDIVWLLAPFENDVASVSAYSEKDALWGSFKEFLDRMILARRKIVVQGIHPATTYNSNGYNVASYLDMMTQAYAEKYTGQVLYWSSPKESYLSLSPSATWTPDTTVKYDFSTGGSGTETDGIHPNGVRHVLLGIDAAQKVNDFLKLGKKSFRDYSPVGTQRYSDSRNLTSGATTTAAGISGTGPGDWAITRSGTGTASATTFIRTDGIAGKNLVIDCSGANGDIISCTWKSTKTLSALGLTSGDKVEILVELTGENLSQSACIPRVELTLVGSFPVYPSALIEMQFTGLGNQLQGQVLGNRNISMIYNPIPWKVLTIPPSCTGFSISIKQTGYGPAWTGTMKIGRISIEKVS